MLLQLVHNLRESLRRHLLQHHGEHGQQLLLHFCVVRWLVRLHGLLKTLLMGQNRSPCFRCGLVFTISRFLSHHSVAEHARGAVESALILLEPCAWNIAVIFFYMVHEQCLGCGGVATLEAYMVIFAQHNMVVPAGLTARLAAAVGVVSAGFE